MHNLSNAARIIAIILLSLTGINAIIAGLLFIIDPSGEKMGMLVNYLKHSPFQTFLIPGITLFIVNGIMNCIAAIAIIKKHTYFPELILLQGLLLSGWIIVQVMMVSDFNWLHALMLTIGILLLCLGMILKFKQNQC
jgi:hypothetical protein